MVSLLMIKEFLSKLSPVSLSKFTFPPSINLLSIPNIINILKFQISLHLQIHTPQADSIVLFDRRNIFQKVFILFKSCIINDMLQSLGIGGSIIWGLLFILLHFAIVLQYLLLPIEFIDSIETIIEAIRKLLCCAEWQDIPVGRVILSNLEDKFEQFFLF